MEATLARTSWPRCAVYSQPRASRIAVSALFFINGALFATWVSRIPALQEYRNLGNGALGLALLAVSIGAVIAMPLTGMLCGRVGSDAACKGSVLLYAAALPLPFIAPNTPLFALSLIFFGASHGALDVAMNAQAVVVEKAYRSTIMSSFHALFSSGGLVGAAAGSLLASRGLSPMAHLAAVAVTLGIVAILTFPHLFRVEAGRQASSANEEKKHRPSRFPWPKGGLLAIGVVALCIMMGEGAMADWTAVYLRNNLKATEGLAAAGYAAFSIAMALGRFTGDTLTARLRPVNVVRLSGLVAAVGVAIALLSHTTALVLAGLACVGVGFATVVPVVFSAAGRIPGTAPGIAIASVTTLGYFGFLLGPPLIGFVAELVGLRIALGTIIVTSLIAAGLAGTVRENRTELR